MSSYNTEGERSPKRSKISKSKPIACRRCHSRKVKCPGGQPCEGCRQAECPSECAYPERDRQIKVAQSYIDGLLEENERLRKADCNTQKGGSISQDPAPTSGPSAVGNEEAARNPLLDERPWFFPVTSLDMPIHIGEAADAAFVTRFRQALADVPVDHLPRTDYAADSDLLVLTEADCAWPSPARARFLLETSLLVNSQCFHIVRRSTVLRDLELAFQINSSQDSLVKCRLWALFALGALYSTKVPSRGSNFPGLAYFAQASRVLRVLVERPTIEYMEILLLISLYSLYLNRRHTAYWLTGSAVRIGVIMGLHLNIPEMRSTDCEMVEHRKRLWWTAYIFDRIWASKIGHPVSIQDDDIEVDTPSQLAAGQHPDDFGDHEYFVANIQLAKLAGRMAASIYGRRMQQGSFSQRVQNTLKELTDWVESLPDHLRNKADPPSSRLPDHVLSLHLLFNQCVILATRPVLLHVLRLHSDVFWTNAQALRPPISESASVLAEACIRCARHSNRLLVRAWISGTFFIFDYFYAQYLFSAITILAISRILKGKDGNTDGEDFEVGTQLLDELKQNGNFGAKEFCRHTDALQLSLHAFLGKTQSTAHDTRAPDVRPSGTGLPNEDVEYNATLVTAGMALTEPSLQEFLGQPDLDLSFMDMSSDQLQGTFLPGLGGESWSAG